MIKRLEDIKLECLQDSWVILYTFVAKELTLRKGDEGERILREAVRRYGRDRGLTNQKRLMDNNIKINLLTLFNEGRDRPGEPRFNLQGHTQYERRAHQRYFDLFVRGCLGSAMTRNIWGASIVKSFIWPVTRLFSFGKAKINLSRSLTQDGDDRCCFYHTYRPENLTDEERRLSFEEFDPGYKKPETPMPKPQGEKRLQYALD